MGERFKVDVGKKPNLGCREEDLKGSQPVRANFFYKEKAEED